MATQQDTKNRISSVKNIQKITRAMEMVAAARLRRAEQRIEALRPYARAIRKLTARVVANAQSIPNMPLLEPRENVETVAILGMAFKANSDDIRNSVSFKLKKQLDFRGYDVRCFDPHVPCYDDWSVIEGADALVLMSPHKEFKDLAGLMERVGNPGALVVDIWGFWDEMRYRSKNGYFIYKEVL